MVIDWISFLSKKVLVERVVMMMRKRRRRSMMMTRPIIVLQPGIEKKVPR